MAANAANSAMVFRSTFGNPRPSHSETKMLSTFVLTLLGAVGRGSALTGTAFSTGPVVSVGTVSSIGTVPKLTKPVRISDHVEGVAKQIAMSTKNPNTVTTLNAMTDLSVL